MPGRITEQFARLRRAGRKGLVAYFTAGDPDPLRSAENIREALAAGVDVLELGIPFSDPTADGPAIQDASQRALAAGMTVGGALDIVRSIRKSFDTPIILFGYANPFFVYGYERLCAEASAAGADGFLVVDLPYEESGELRESASRHGLAVIPLIAPTTSPERARMILRDAEGFVYYISVTGVTGARDRVAGDLSERIGELRRCTDLPIAVGFGISDGRQARAAAVAADAVVVGSALVRAAFSGKHADMVRLLREALDATTITRRLGQDD